MVCLVHADDEVVELCQHVRKGSTERLLKFVEVELCVGIAVENFSDVEDEKLNL